MCPTQVGNLLSVESGKLRFYVRWEANDIIAWRLFDLGARISTMRVRGSSGRKGRPWLRYSADLIEIAQVYNLGRKPGPAELGVATAVAHPLRVLPRDDGLPHDARVSLSRHANPLTSSGGSRTRDDRA